jgi:hypothetical protein
VSGFSRTTRRLVFLLFLAVSVGACHPLEDPVRAAMRVRLKQDTRLTPAEIEKLFNQIAPTVAEKRVTVRQGALSRTLDDAQRVSVLGMLADPGAVYDAGLRVQGKSVWRGLKTGGTAPLSELDATQTLWIDVDTFVPRRYEYEYSSPGFGDYTYDLTFGP